MDNVLLVAPVEGNGGIQSWTRKYIKTFDNPEYKLIHIGVSSRRSLAQKSDKFHRVKDGILDLIDVRKAVRKAIRESDIKIFHTTTSGDLGTLRDFVLCRICKKYGIKTIMHCRYGCIPNDFAANGFWGNLLRKTMHLFDMVWVLDTRSQAALLEDEAMKGKVFLTPNSIQVPVECDLSPKEYKRVGFIGNLIPVKGLYELIQAVCHDGVDAELFVVGPGPENVVNHIKEIAGENLDTKVHILGKLPNEEAVELIKTLDIVALPTYYPSEAFPISIIEAMSRGKMVISTDRAAIPDMLTALDKSRCGILVREKSVEDIIDAIHWCQEHKEESDAMCAKAYDKVKTCYDMSVIYKLYASLYDKLIY